MTKVLFLDDMIVRANVMRTKFPDLRHATTSSHAIQYLYGEYYELVCLDYDLDLSLPGDNGMKVVGWLVGSSVPSRLMSSEYVVHSTNLLMGTKMVHRLTEAGFSAHYVPFTYLMGGPFNK